MKEQTREHPQIVAAAERKMRAWSLAQEIAQTADPSRRIDQPHAPTGDFITISREAGAGASEIAEQVGRTLGWEVLDKNLLDCIAQRFHISRPVLELVDETPGHWAYDVFGAWLDRGIVPHERYVSHLSRIILAAARRGKVVFVGRGAQFLLPGEQGLAVRIIASEKFRIGRVMEKYGLGEAQARHYIAEVDRGRRDFVSKFFHRDVADPHLYDLVVTVDHLGLDGAAEQIVVAWQRRQARGTTRPAPATQA